MPIENWFSVPIFAYDFTGDALDVLQREIGTVMPDISNSMLPSPWGDTVKTTFEFEKTNDIKTHKLIKLESALSWALDTYIKSINYNGPQMTLTESWFNSYSTGGFQYDHTHAGNKVSGTYYYATNGEDGAIRFSNPNQHMHFNGFPSDGSFGESASYTPKVGRLLLFPSWLTHRVNVNNTNHTRISIAMNFK